MPVTSLNESVDEMLRELRDAGELYQPSAFWEELCRTNTRMLELRGLDNFKRTVSQNYFTWLIRSVFDPQFRSVFRQWSRRPSRAPLAAGAAEFTVWTPSSVDEPLRCRGWHSWLYRTFVTMLWEYATSQDKLNLADELTEPALGNPIPIQHRGRLISQDLANSLIELNLIAQTTGSDFSTVRTVGELGAGYGRLGHLVSLTGRRYLIFDIPPALHLSQWYLSSLFPEKKVFRFRHFQTFEDIRNELAECDLGFFSSNQLEKFPPQYFDLLTTISTFPEMRADQVTNYLQLFSDKSRQFLYIKQWKQWFNEPDRVCISRDHYTLPQDWQGIYDASDKIMPAFFNRVWRRVA